MTIETPSPLTPELMAQLGIQVPAPKKAAGSASPKKQTGLGPSGDAEATSPESIAPLQALLQTADLGASLSTADLTVDEQEAAGAKEALPFKKGQAKLDLAPRSVGSMSLMPGFGSTLDLSPRQAFDAATATAATPFDATDGEGKDISLGQHFLAAMSALRVR